MRTATLAQLATPAFVVDRAIVEANARRMREKAETSGVRLRPHVKTHKTLEAARLQHGGATGPITVSTLAEAEFYAGGGFDDIVYAVPLGPGKCERAAALARRIRLSVLIDDRAPVEAIEALAPASPIPAFVKIDCGYHRAGIAPESEQLIDLVRRISASNAIILAGVLTHAGHSYHAAGREEIVQIAAAEATAVIVAATRIARITGERVVMSIGSTPTAAAVDRFPAVDEVRPGNYIFYDAFQAAIGSCTLSDCAATVITEIVGLYERPRRAVVDAGALALSKDRGAEHVGAEGFGIVCDLAMNPLPLELEALSQEHGILIETAPGALDRLDVGARLRIIPNHSCLTAAMFDTYFVLEGDRIVDEWRPVRGW